MAAQATMSVKDGLLADFDNEMATTRKHLERVPADKMDWSPHEKSMTLGRLASHLTECPSWTGAMTEQDSFDIAPPEGFDYQPQTFSSPKEVIDGFDKAVAEARELINAKSDAELMAPWTFKKGGNALFTVPKMVAIQNHVIKHAIHHRGQISVYLRMCGAPVPQTYGPTADEVDF